MRLDKQTLLALLLTTVVIVVTPLIFKTPNRPVAPRDSVAVVDSTRRAQTAPSAPTRTVSPTPAPLVVRRQKAETTIVRTARAIYQFVSPGGSPAEVTLPEFRSLRPGIPGGAPVRLVAPGGRLFHMIVARGADTVALDTVFFRAQPQRVEGTTTVQSFVSTSIAGPVTLNYRFPADSFVMQVEGVVARPASGSTKLLFALPMRLRSEEADVKDDTRHLAFAFRIGVKDPESRTFRSLDTLFQADSGVVRWFAERNKYFVVAAVPFGRDSAFERLMFRRDSMVNDEAESALGLAVLPVSTDRFTLRVYAGPQTWEQLRATAPELENVNPYGGWLHRVVQPFATIMMRLILWTRETLNVGYGWVLVIFGISVRMLMWPLTQNATRSSMKLQRLQPQQAELQKKFGNDPKRYQEAVMKMYADNGMSPFSPILGCLPMLIPMPILFALYFVFQNTIELRGVAFMWLPDLALKDPYYITPLFMGVSMYVLSWIGMRGLPPNPQSKMMLYMMPVMFTVMFWNFASGLNLYYAVQNVAALPQQWLLAHERAKQKPTAVAVKPGGKAPSG